MHGFGAFGHVDGDGNAAAMNHTTGGMFIGADGRIAGNWHFGALAGYSYTGFTVDDRASSGAANSFHAGLYGGTKWTNLAFRFGGAYSLHDITLDRSVVFTGFSDSLSSNYWAGTGQVFGELAYGMDAGTSHFEPFANLAYVRHTTNGFTEQGGDAALIGTGDTTNTAFTTLGVRASSRFAMGAGKTAKLTGTLGWRHAFGDVDPNSTLAFAGGSNFTVKGAPLAGDVLVLEAGLDFRIAPMATLDMTYSGQLGSGVSDHALKASLGVSF